MEERALQTLRLQASILPQPGEWIRLTPRNLELGYRYLEVMCQMNRASYETERPEWMAMRMAQRPCEYYYQAGKDYELVCGFKWYYRRRLYRWMSVGFVGAITPQRAVDLVVEKVRTFLFEKRVRHLIAIEPSVMDSSDILEFYRLTRQHPGLIIRGSHQLEGGTYLWIRLPG